jgi:predicted ArsR family transcriptional regulator
MTHTTKPLPREYDERILAACKQAMTGWLMLGQIAYKMHTSDAVVRPHIKRLVDEGILLERTHRGDRQFAIAPQKDAPQ